MLWVFYSSRPVSLCLPILFPSSFHQLRQRGQQQRGRNERDHRPPTSRKTRAAPGLAWPCPAGGPPVSDEVRHFVSTLSRHGSCVLITCVIERSIRTTPPSAVLTCARQRSARRAFMRACTFHITHNFIIHHRWHRIMTDNL